MPVTVYWYVCLDIIEEWVFLPPKGFCACVSLCRRPTREYLNCLRIAFLCGDFHFFFKVLEENRKQLIIICIFPLSQLSVIPVEELKSQIAGMQYLIFT